MSQLDPYDPTRRSPAVARQQGWPAPQPAWAGRGQLSTDQRPVSSGIVATAWVCAVLTVGYLLPWAIAATRGRSNQAAVGLVNLFLGWSLIGWIVALVMACQAHAVVAATPNVTVVLAQQFPQPGYSVPPPVAGPPASWYQSPAGTGQEYWDGIAWTGHRAP